MAGKSNKKAKKFGTENNEEISDEASPNNGKVTDESNSSKKDNSRKRQNNNKKEAESTGKRSKQMEQKEKNSKGKTTTVTFQESENELMQMAVEENLDFLDDMDEGDSEEEEGEISFNNNASTLRRSEDRRAGKQNKSQDLETETVTPVDLDHESSSKQTRETDEERENRIVSKTFEKLRDLMTQGGYFTKNSTEAHQKKPKTGRSSSEGKSEVIACNSTSESTIYHDAIQPANQTDNRVTLKDLNNALKQVKTTMNNKRDSSSSEEEVVNTSDESMGEQVNNFLNNIRD